MRIEVILPLALLFLSSGDPTNAQMAAGGEGGAREAQVAVAAGAPLLVECALRVDEEAAWRLDGRAVPADMRAAPEAPPRAGWLTARLQAAAARAHHAGRYTCARGPAARAVRVSVLPAPAEGVSGAEGASGAMGASGASEAMEGAQAATDVPPELYYDVYRPLELNCTNPAAAADVYTWRKNGTELAQVWEMSGRYELREGGAVLRMRAALEDDFGNYSCAGGGGWARAWRVRGRPVARLPANANVVEGQKIKLQCKVVGKPYPRVTWTFRNGSDEGNGTEVAGEQGEEARVRVEASDAGVEGGALTLAAARRADAGVYTCAPARGAPAATTLRVKDMYAALWPFLGICAEVFVLCAIILVYEKRRTKPELDDSDTDNHDQKKS